MTCTNGRRVSMNVCSSESSEQGSTLEFCEFVRGLPTSTPLALASGPLKRCFLRATEDDVQ